MATDSRYGLPLLLAGPKPALLSDDSGILDPAILDSEDAVSDQVRHFTAQEAGQWASDLRILCHQTLLTRE